MTMTEVDLYNLGNHPSYDDSDIQKKSDFLLDVLVEIMKSMSEKDQSSIAKNLEKKYGSVNKKKPITKIKSLYNSL